MLKMLHPHQTITISDHEPVAKHNKPVEIIGRVLTIKDVEVFGEDCDMEFYEIGGVWRVRVSAVEVVKN